jgi:exonuclease III
VNIIQCYAPTNDADHAVKEEFYQKLAHILEKWKKRKITWMGDLNAKVGDNNTGFEEVMGKHGLGDMNEKVEMFANLFTNHS